MGFTKNINQKFVGAIDIDIVLKDIDNNIISAIRISEIEDGGHWGIEQGGTNSDIAEVIYKYVKNNLLN